MMVAIGMVACSIVTGCMSEASSRGGTYANLPDPKPDEYLMHWENKGGKIEAKATVKEILKIFDVGDKPHWMLRDKENYWGLIPLDPSIRDKARMAALFKACQQNKCEAIIGAMYDVEVSDYLLYKEAKCTVRGWPANITGIENVANKVK